MSQNEELKLKVVEADAKDVGRGIVRIGEQNRKSLDLTTGDYVKITGDKSTVAIVWPAHPRYEGGDIISMDGILRHNAGVTLGDPVRVSKTEVEKADRIVLAPTEQIRVTGDFGDYVKQIIVGMPLTRGDIVYIPVLGTALRLLVTGTRPKGTVAITNLTQIEISSSPASETEVRRPLVTYEDIGGLKDEIERIREMVELPMKHPELFTHLGIEPPRGVLLHGPPGTGKTLLAKAVANEASANFASIAGPEIMSKFYGESEERLRQIFEEAEKNAPSIIFIDELDAIAPSRGEVTGEVEKRVVAQLLSLMDGLKSRGQVVVIGATNRPDAVEPALRRPGRFDREITIKIPDKNGRKEILQIHTRNMPLSEEMELGELGEVTHGYSGADIASLCREAAMRALRRYLPKIDLEKDTIPLEVLRDLKVEKEDFDGAFKEIQPSLLRQIAVEIPTVRWNDIGGLEEEKRLLREAVEIPLKDPDLFDEMGIRPPRGILLYGPPGSGKTMLAKAVATESEANFISIRGPELLSKWVGESEKGVREIFKKAREAAPCIVFFDEIDSIAPQRGSRTGDSGVTERVVNQILTEIDGVVLLKDVVVVAATNRPDLLDPALLRPGRIDRIIYVGAPDEKARLQILKIHTRNMPLSHSVDLEQLAKILEGYTGADIESLCREAAMIAVRKDYKAREVEWDHFEKALERIPPSVDQKAIQRFQSYVENQRKVVEQAPPQSVWT
ncbi:MAG: CDC48 family AAA ATPase [Candidatus Bathyarchaeota archaeon]|nr:MAG: CDC48 family AAA ATPase [Candidatus Bathyarchaeota archaeon]